MRKPSRDRHRPRYPHRIRRLHVPALPGSGYVASSLPIPSSPRGKVVRGPADVGVANWGPPPPAGDPSALAAEAAEVELPPGRGHGYLFGEAMVVSRLRRSWPSEGSPKAYWGRGRANASHGELAQDA